MLSLATYIEYQLMTRHFAYVPGIGAWMLRDVEAEGLHAPHQEVFFNRFACHDDGMTANLMMEAEGLTYDEAQARIAYEACQWQTLLQRDGRMMIHGVGQLYLDESRNLAFDTTGVSSPCYFGLEEVVLQTLVEHHEGKTLADKTTTVATEDSKTTTITTGDAETATASDSPAIIPSQHLSLAWMKHVAACLLIVLGLFTATKGSLINADHQRDYASMVDMDILLGKANPYTLVHESWEEYIVSTDLQEVMELDSEGMSEVDAQPAATQAAHSAANEVAQPAANEATQPLANKDTWIDSQLATERAMQTSPSGKLYYIIVASCSSNEEAQHAVARMAKQGYDSMHILERDGRFRIYINYFQLKDDAEDNLRQVRETTKFKDAWMLPVRAQSLSHIIKNTYNGNQLSMELPRLNPTAERDQG